MSEYQYYEWQAIDRPLTQEEEAGVDDLSSHIYVTSRQAQVDYSWGDFKHDPLDVLTDYFDAFIYMANWGSAQLAFRFPADLLDPLSMQPYLVQDYITLEKRGTFFVLDLEMGGDEPSRELRIHYEGVLTGLLPLRDEILKGNYGVLYLAWLRAVELVGGFEIAEDEPEPPVPATLKKLSPAQQRFVEWCELDTSLVKGAQKEAAQAGQSQPDIDWAKAIGQLSREECNDFLLRLLADETNLSLTLRRRLEAAVSGRPIPKAGASQRTVGEILEEME